MRNDDGIRVAEVSSECGISIESVYIIIHEHLGMSEVSAQWVPRKPNMQDRQQMLESSQELLEVHNANPEDSHSEPGDRFSHDEANFIFLLWFTVKPV